ncbi:MAG: tetratricopeptide repeat protein [Candidatus Omnitrophica bacterium]|nr:tetratricopeptide repeat protein [Candidatus Omnitrophota bacterium]
MYVTENKAIRSITLTNLKNISTSFFITHYQPVTIFSYLLEYHFFKLNPFNYHLTNLILHLLNCLLVFWLFYLISGRASVAWITAILFGIHPMQVESVAWISERKNLLYAFFFLGALISYLYYLRKDKAVKYYFLCLGLFILALSSKSMAMTLPLVLFLLDYFYSRKINPAAFIEKIPYFLLSILFGLLASLGSFPTQTFYVKSSFSFFTKLLGASGDVIFYLNKLLLPVKLSVLYPYIEIKNNPFYLYSFVLMIILVVAIIISIRYTKKVILGSGIFLLIVFPVIRFLPLDYVLTADRYIYLAVIGIFYLLALGYLWLYTGKTKHAYLLKTFLVIAMAGVIISLGSATWKRCHTWKDSLSLWNDILEKYPDTAVAFSHRGEVLLRQGKYHQALFDFMQAVNVQPGSPDDPIFNHRYLNLGLAWQALGKNQEAAAVFERLIKEAETYFNSADSNGFTNSKNKVAAANWMAVKTGAYFKFANMKDLLNDRNKVVAAHWMTLEVGSYFNLASIKDALGDKDGALELYARAIELAPRFLYAHDSLGTLYLSLNRKEFFDAYYYCGNLALATQRDKDAVLFYKKALELNPGSKESCVGLANAYLITNRSEEAILLLKKALELDPALAVAHNNLALAYYYAQEYTLAIQHCDQAVQLGYPRSPKLLELLEPYRK